MPPHHGDPTPGAVTDLLERVGSFALVEPSGASSGLQREAVMALAELVGRAEALLVSWLGAFDAACVHTIDGARTAPSWLAATTELDRAACGALAARARDLRACSHVAAAFADGRLGSAKVRALLDARTAYPDLFADHEQELVDRVVPLTVTHARVAIGRWKALAEATKDFDEAQAERERLAAAGANGPSAEGGGGPGGEDASAGGGEGAAAGAGDASGAGHPADGTASSPDAGGAPSDAEDGAAGGGASGRGEHDPRVDEEPAPDPAAGNVLRLSQTFQGRWVLDGELDPVSGAELDEAIQAYVDARFREGTWSKDDGRTAAWRRAHALVELVLRGSSASSRQGDPRPSVAVRIDPATLAGLPAGTLAEGLERECCLDDGTPVDARSIERLLCTARIQALWTRVRHDGTIETLGVTDLLRDATRAQRRALKQRDGRCVFPGCGAPAEWCDAHHLIPNEDLGPTLLHNLVLLCRFHHHLVHEGGWTLWRDPTSGHLHLLDPEHRPRPMGQPGTKQPVLHPDQLTPVRPPPAPPHLRPPRYQGRREPPDARPSG
jgi:hypothetical protein